jgi:glycerol-3-phosphate acyltransferase PlsY
MKTPTLFGILSMDIFTIIIGIFAYLIGAIPTGYLVAKCKGISDIRAHGSGNIGATNVSRVLGKHYFFLIFFLDAGKAFLYIHLLKPYTDFSHLCIYAGLLLFGNICSLFLQGSGGKGVATLLGLVGALEHTAVPFLLLIWVFILMLTHTVGIASVIAVACLPVYVCWKTNNYDFLVFSFHHPFYLFSLFATGLILWKHRSNIQAYWNNR